MRYYYRQQNWYVLAQLFQYALRVMYEPAKAAQLRYWRLLRQHFLKREALRERYRMLSDEVNMLHSQWGYFPRLKQHFRKIQQLIQNPLLQKLPSYRDSIVSFYFHSIRGILFSDLAQWQQAKEDYEALIQTIQHSPWRDERKCLALLMAYLNLIEVYLKLNLDDNVEKTIAFLIDSFTKMQQYFLQHDRYYIGAFISAYLSYLLHKRCAGVYEAFLQRLGKVSLLEQWGTTYYYDILLNLSVMAFIIEDYRSTLRFIHWIEQRQKRYPLPLNHRLWFYLLKVMVAWEQQDRLYLQHSWRQLYYHLRKQQQHGYLFESLAARHFAWLTKQQISYREVFKKSLKALEDLIHCHPWEGRLLGSLPLAQWLKAKIEGKPLLSYYQAMPPKSVHWFLEWMRNFFSSLQDT